MNFSYTPNSLAWQSRLQQFMDENVYPIEAHYTPDLLDGLKGKARAAGLWNLFLPHSSHLDEVEGKQSPTAVVFFVAVVHEALKNIRFHQHGQALFGLEPICIVGEVG